MVKPKYHDYVKPKYHEKAQLFYADTDSFLVYIKKDKKNIGWDVETRFDTSNYESGRPCLKEKIKKVIGLMKDE